MTNFSLLVVRLHLSLIKMENKLDLDQESKVVANYSQLFKLPFKHSINISGLRLTRRDIKLCHYKAYLDMVPLIQITKVNSSDLISLIIKLSKVQLYSLTTLQEKLWMYLAEPGKRERDQFNGKKIKDGIKDGDLLKPAKVLLFKAYLITQPQILQNRKEIMEPKLSNGIRPEGQTNNGSQNQLETVFSNSVRAMNHHFSQLLKSKKSIMEENYKYVTKKTHQCTGEQKEHFLDLLLNQIS